MRLTLILVLGVILSFLLPALILQLVYGPSFGFLSGEDCWVPDGSGGWQAHGSPAGPPPAEPSILLPFYMHYIPYAASVLFLVFAWRRLKARS